MIIKIFESCHKTSVLELKLEKLLACDNHLENPTNENRRFFVGAKNRYFHTQADIQQSKRNFYIVPTAANRLVSSLLKKIPNTFAKPLSFPH